MISKEGSPPIVVVANKMDLPDAMNVDEVRQALAIPKQIPVLPCNSLDESSVRGVLLELTSLIPT
jgi:signal recognition particle receptor subunit beta